MKFSHLSLAGALLGGLLVQVAPAAAQSSDEYAPNEILIQTAPLSASAVQRFQAQSGASVISSFPNVGWNRVKLPAGTSVTQAVAQYTKIAGVISAEPNYRFHTYKTPGDLLYRELWGMRKINAPQAWDVTTGKSDIVVAVCDTGIKYDHPDLAANMWHNPREIPNNGKDDDNNGYVDDVYGYDAFNNDANPMDDNGHGTHCAGVIGAVGDGRGLVGVNWKVQLMALKHAGADGVSLSSDSVAAYEYAIIMKKRGVNLRVISNSWGGRNESLAVKSIMTEAAKNGIISICAAGNDGTDNDLRGDYPSSSDVPGLVAVAASDRNDQPASFSSYGQTTVDLAAPGVDILSTFIGSGNSAYNYESGTSMACPHVAGAAALLLSQAPGLGVEEVKNRLLKSVDVLPQWRELTASHGRLNVGKLLSGRIYRIGGRLLSSSGQPLAGALIYLGDSSTPITQSRRDGYYSVDGLAAGSYLLTAKLPAWKFTPTPARVTIPTGAPYAVRQDFTGTTSEAVYSITGLVYELNGTVQKPIEGAQIFMGSSTEPIAVSNASGHYTIANRAAGTYYLRAQYGNYDIKSVDRSNAVAVVNLPRKSTDKQTTDFVAKKTDRTSPTLVIRAPTSGTVYGPSELTRAYGNAADENGVKQMEFLLYRSTGAGTSYYSWTTKTWTTPGSAGSDIYLIQPYDSPAVSWSIDSTTFPTLDVGNYTFIAYAYDNSANLRSQIVSFTVQEASTQNGYPVVAINSPGADQKFVSGSGITAKGTAKDEQGIDKVYLYLRRFDERGQLIGYYNWVTKTWNGDNTSINVYRTFEGQKNLAINWSQLLPNLVPGNYEVGAFGRDIYGHEPLLDGSQDTVKAFTVLESTGPAIKAPSASAGNS